MLKTQIEIKNALLELVSIQKQKLEIKQQKLEILVQNPYTISYDVNN